MKFEDVDIGNIRTYNDAIKEVYRLVFEFFNNDEKANDWLHTPNPNLGNCTPNDLILEGRVHKVLKFIKSSLSENRDNE